MRPRKINDSNRDQIAENLKAMSRKEVCAKWGVTYPMLSAEYGHKWKHTKGETVELAESVN